MNSSQLTEPQLALMEKAAKVAAQPGYAEAMLIPVIANLLANSYGNTDKNVSTSTLNSASRIKNFNVDVAAKSLIQDIRKQSSNITLNGAKSKNISPVSKKTFVGENNSANIVLDNIYTFMVKSRDEDDRRFKTEKSFAEAEFNTKAKRHKEIINIFLEATNKKRNAIKMMEKSSGKKSKNKSSGLLTKLLLAGGVVALLMPGDAIASVEKNVKDILGDLKDKTKEFDEDKVKKVIDEVDTVVPEFDVIKSEIESLTKGFEDILKDHDANGDKESSDQPPPKKQQESTDTSTPQSSTPESKPSATPIPEGAKPSATKAPTQLTGGARVSVLGETSATTEAGAIVKGGQIVKDTGGSYSYGIFGMNSKAGTIDQFVKDNPQFNLKGLSGTSEFNKQWEQLAKDRPVELYQAQLAWYDKYITKPVQANLNSKLPEHIANDPRVLAYMSDRRIQTGKKLEDAAIQYAKNSKDGVNFVLKIAEFDSSDPTLKQVFPTYLSEHPDHIGGLRNRVERRKQLSLEMQNVDSSGTKLAAASVDNVNYKKEMRSVRQGTIIAQSTTNNLIQENGPTVAPTKSEINPWLKQYFGN
jgi:hypothetical protein